MKASFATREPGRVPRIYGSHTPGIPPRTVIIEGDSVTLKVDSESVLVHKVQVLGQGKYRGQIHGFEPSCALDYKGHSLEDIVDFEEMNVFAIQLP